tara:strand:+ start:2825 stop:3928 length:1104 start_codon:yes stop_codon:yes gene_type:complete
MFIWNQREEIQNNFLELPPITSPKSKWYERETILFEWPPLNSNKKKYSLVNQGIADLRGIDISSLKLISKERVLFKTEDWENVSNSADLPGYPSLVHNIYGKDPDNRYYLFYAVHEPPSGIGLAIADNLKGSFLKLSQFRHGPRDSRVLKAPSRPRGTSHFSSPVVLWNPHEKLWFMYFHFYNNETEQGFGHQKTALAYTESLTHGEWKIYTDDKQKYITPMPVKDEWMNSQSSYHAVSRLEDQKWIALLRGTNLENINTALGFAASNDGIKWAIMPPTPFLKKQIKKAVSKPVAIALDDDGVKIIWSIYDKQEWTTKAYISPIEGFSEKNSEIFLPEWVPSDGASSIWREGSQLIIFSGNSRYIFE